MTLAIRTRCVRSLHGIWARICPRLGVLERYPCHHTRMNPDNPPRTRTAIVCGLFHAYSPTVAWLTMKTTRTVAIIRSRPPKKSRCLKGTFLNVRKFFGHAKNRAMLGIMPIGPLQVANVSQGLSSRLGRRYQRLLDVEGPSPVSVCREKTANDGTADASQCHNYTQN